MTDMIPLILDGKETKMDLKGFLLDIGRSYGAILKKFGCLSHDSILNQACCRLKTRSTSKQIGITGMEGLESFAGLLRGGVAADDDSERTYAYAADGRRYLSARGA
jgi:hypothetical protein